MSANVRLQKTGSGWEFERELDLEDFLWENLEPLFGLTPLKRQHYVKEQFCDIIAVGENKQLVVQELKNVQDRYIVQQLTRYYDALLEDKPFSEELEYDRPVRLIAIAPSFHRDNFTDRKYHTLSFEFLQFSVIQQGELFYLQLTDVDSGAVFKVEIPYTPQERDDDIPPLPRTMHALLTKCTENEGAGILRIRRKLLTFDSRMQEICSANNIIYGKDKNKYCAELRWNAKSNQTVLFLKLPLLNRRRTTGRIRVWTDWEKVTEVLYVKQGFGRFKTLEELKNRSESSYEYSQLLGKYRYGGLDSGVALPIQSYLKSLTLILKDFASLKIEEYEFLEKLVELALEEWLLKIG